MNPRGLIQINDWLIDAVSDAIPGTATDRDRQTGVSRTVSAVQYFRLYWVYYWLFHSTVWRICLVGGRSVLPAPAAWWCRRLGCPLSVVGASTSLLLVSGIGCPKTLPRRRRYQHSGIFWKLTFSNSHIRMLLYIRHPSGPCGDTGQLCHYKSNWTELNWTVPA